MLFVGDPTGPYCLSPLQHGGGAMEAITASDSNVLGHYCRAGNSDSEWQPVLGEATSTPLFTAVVEDSISTVESYFERDLSRINAFSLLLYWGAEGEDEKNTQGAQTDQGPQKVQVKPRTLAMIAAYHGSLRVLAFFLSKGADPRLKTPDGLTAADCECCQSSTEALSRCIEHCRLFCALSAAPWQLLAYTCGKLKHIVRQPPH